MKKTTILSVLAAGVFAVACSKPKEPTAEWTKKIATDMCGKMTECAGEMMKKIPGGLPGGMPAPKMPTKEECIQKAMEGFESTDMKKELTAEEVEAAKACSADILKAECSQIHSAMGSEACQKFQQMASSKE